MKILLITSSARGHAIAEALARSPQEPEIVSICTTHNPGIESIASEMHVLDIMNFDAVLDVAKKCEPDFAFIGPDDPIGMGLADALKDIGIPSVAPLKTLAQVEASKGFTRNLCEKYGIDASPKFRVFTEANREEIESYIAQELEEAYVVKYDALKGGKGVKVSGEHLQSVEEGVLYANECIDECGRVVIEEKLIGVEFSLLSFVSGSAVVSMPAVQDHKRAYEDDTGPNTGGMGTWSCSDHSLPFLENSDIARAKEINQQTADALEQECGAPFVGILYGGFIATKNGVKLIEYNARFGDPEALNILPLLTSDFVAICQGMIDGTLSEDMVTFEHKATVCKYITPKSYPVSKENKGEEVVFPEIPANARLYFGDISKDSEGILRLGGSRTAGIVGMADTVEEAERITEELCSKVKGPVRYRSDIGTDALIQKRIDTMNRLRG